MQELIQNLALANTGKSGRDVDAQTLAEIVQYLADDQRAEGNLRESIALERAARALGAVLDRNNKADYRVAYYWYERGRDDGESGFFEPPTTGNAGTLE